MGGAKRRCVGYCMGWLTRPCSHYLRDALTRAAKAAAIAERELAWHERLSDADRWRAERDRAVHRCERLLAYAVARGVVSERTARRLAGCVYDALATERRWMQRRAYRDDPEGHWPRMEALTAGIAGEWRSSWWRCAWNERLVSLKGVDR